MLELGRIENKVIVDKYIEIIGEALEDLEELDEYVDFFHKRDIEIKDVYGVIFRLVEKDIRNVEYEIEISEDKTYFEVRDVNVIERSLIRIGFVYDILSSVTNYEKEWRKVERVIELLRGLREKYEIIKLIKERYEKD